MKKLFFFLTFICLCSFTASAQNIDQIYQQALDAYENGHFEETDSILTPHINSMSQNDLVRSYRLLALSSFYQDRLADTEIYASRLLAADPFYTAYDETPRFRDIIEKLKHSKTTVSTASKMKESIEEVPVPVTLITEDMIRHSGAKCLEDVLLLYVPGMAKIASPEMNVSMRGIYGLAQETMLVMVDGHRLNSVTTNASALDFQHSLDKIKQIEVLRGPASSLYGNVALTAVINIITKSGDDVNGGQVTARGGSFKMMGLDAIFGRGNLQTDLLAWGHVYSSQGEKRELAGTTHYIGGFCDKPSYEFGGKMRWGDFQVEAIGQYSKTVPYYPFICVTDVFSYDKYHVENGDKPGFSHKNIRLDVDYSHAWNNLSLSVSAFANTEHINMYNVLGDTVDYMVAAMLGQALGLKEVKTRGVWQTASWDDYSFGSTITGAYNYELHNGMRGAVMLGIQYENYIFSNAEIKIGADFENINNSMNNIFIDNPEHTLSSFMQLKHNFSSRLIFNGGLRFDHKIRQNDRRLNTWSPRLSLIYLANDVLSIKGGYSFAFVDAPLFFRASTISLLSGGENLDPEKMQSYQVGAILNWKELGLRYEANLFYNRVEGMIGYNTSAETVFYNAGNIKMGGVENVVQFSRGKTFANLNFTYQYPFKVEEFLSTEHNISNVPKFLLNLTASQGVWENETVGRFDIRGNIHFQSAMECLENDLVKKMLEPDKLFTTHEDAYLLFNAGAEWTSTFGLSIGIDINNIFDTAYRYGGQLRSAYPGQGRNMMCSISYKF